MYYYLSDTTNGNSINTYASVPSEYYCGKSAEFITEFPVGPPDVPNFNPVVWSGCYYSDGLEPLVFLSTSVKTNYCEAYDNSEVLCIGTSAINNGTNGFTNTFHNYFN
jgi:hypothetical protein